MIPEQQFHHEHLTSVLAKSSGEGENCESVGIALSVFLMSRVCGVPEPSVSAAHYPRFALKTIRLALRTIARRSRETLLHELRDRRRFMLLGQTTLDGLGAWVRSVSMDSDAGRVKLAASFDDVPGLLPQFLRSRVGIGGGALRLRDMMLELAQVRPGDRVFDPCFGTGGLLISLMTGRGYPANLVVGLETCPAKYLLGVARAMLCGHSSEGLFFEDPFACAIQKSPHLGKYDRVLLAPRWGEKLKRRQKTNAGSTSRAENAHVQLALRALRSAGRAVIIINNGFLSGENDKKVRQLLLEDRAVAEIIQLPEGVFEPETSARASLLVLQRDPSRDKIVFCDISQGSWSPPGRRTGIPEEHFVAALRAQRLGPKLAWTTPASLLLAGHRAELRVRRPEAAIPPLIAKLERGGFEVSPLQKIARVVSGKTVRKKDRAPLPVKEGALGVLRIKDISNGRIASPLLYMKPKSVTLVSANQHIKAGDVLVSMKGTLAKVVSIPRGAPDYAISDSLIILRPKGKRLLPEYLAALLRSRSYQEWLLKQGTGSTGQKRIQAAVFRAMLIPLPSVEVQRSIASRPQDDAGALLIEIAERGATLPWRETELRAMTKVYFWFRESRAADRHIDIKYVYDFLIRKALVGRSHADVEMAFMGISAVLDEVGEPWCKSFAPVNTYPDALRGAVLDHLGCMGILEVDDYLTTESADVLSVRTQKIFTSKRVIGGVRGKIRGNPQPKRTERKSSVYQRSPLVKAFVLDVAQGCCEMCGEEGPFQVEDWPYRFLEIHHIKRLAEGGPDTPQNAVAVCPNCHRLLHLASEAEVTRARERLFSQVPRLRRFAP